MERGAWGAAVHKIAKSRIRLECTRTHPHTHTHTLTHLCINIYVLLICIIQSTGVDYLDNLKTVFQVNINDAEEEKAHSHHSSKRASRMLNSKAVCPTAFAEAAKVRTLCMGKHWKRLSEAHKVRPPLAQAIAPTAGPSLHLHQGSHACKPPLAYAIYFIKMGK